MSLDKRWIDMTCCSKIRFHPRLPTLQILQCQSRSRQRLQVHAWRPRAVVAQKAASYIPGSITCWVEFPAKVSVPPTFPNIWSTTSQTWLSFSTPQVENRQLFGISLCWPSSTMMLKRRRASFETQIFTGKCRNSLPLKAGGVAPEVKVKKQNPTNILIGRPGPWN